jgi:arginine-tRNA-protein transferase
LRLDDKLLCVAVTDIVNTGLSSVYTYFDPDLPQRSLGTTAIMMQIELARTMKLPYVYLGYWIEASDKMKYKSTFTAQEKFINDRWV